MGPLVHLRDPVWAVEVVHPRRTEGAKENMDPADLMKRKIEARALGH